MMNMSGQDREGDMIKGSKKENGKIHKISFRTTEDEYQMILKKSKNNNKSITEYLLYLVKKDK